MDKQETIRFLKAACDLESAIEACNQELEDLNTKKELLGAETQVPKPRFPKPPSKFEKISRVKEIGCLVITLVLTGFVIFVIMHGLVKKSLGDIGLIGVIAELIDFVIWFIAAIGAVYAFYWFITLMGERIGHNSLYKKSIQETERYNAECKRITDNHQRVHNAAAKNQKQKLDAIQELDGYIRKVQAKKFELEQLRSSFYDKGPLYKDYQNSLVAVTSIYSYMASGISDRLEGPDGALAQYQQDIRANRICTELREFKQAMLDGLQIIINNQNALRSQLEEINDNLQRVELAVRDNTKQMQALAQINFQNQKSIVQSLEALNNEVWVNTQEVRMGNFISFLDYTDRKAATARSYV